jgi:hypothetical protein
MTRVLVSFKIKPLNKTQLSRFYGVGRATFNAWLKDVPELGEYRGRLFTANQVQAIVNHLGDPSGH